MRKTALSFLVLSIICKWYNDTELLISNFEIYTKLEFFKYTERKLRPTFEYDLIYGDLKVFPNYISTTGKKYLLIYINTKLAIIFANGRQK